MSLLYTPPLPPIPLVPSLVVANAMLNRGAGGSAWTPPANLEWGLFLTMPDDSGAGGVEVSAGDYGRITAANSKAFWSVATERSVENLVELAFADPSSAWGEVAGLAAFDAADHVSLFCRSIAFPWLEDGYLVAQRDAPQPTAAGFRARNVGPGARFVVPAGGMRVDIGEVWVFALPVQA
jgi:hypothetical protein